MSFFRKNKEIRDKLVPIIDTSIMDKIVTVEGHPKYQDKSKVVDLLIKVLSKNKVDRPIGVL